MISKFTGEVFAELHPVDGDPKLCWRYFEKTGCLITATGEYDDLIRPQGFPDDYYKRITAGPEPRKQFVSDWPAF